MSSSPTICASPNFVFPATSNPSPSKEDTFDYFSIARTARQISSHQVRASSSSSHSKATNSISSIGSDQTVVTDCPKRGPISRRTDSIMSTDTLIDENSKHTVSLNLKNLMNLSISAGGSFSKHNHNHSVNSDQLVFSGKSTSMDELFGNQRNATSAMETSFNFGLNSGSTPKKYNTRPLPQVPTEEFTSFLATNIPLVLKQDPPILRKQQTLPSFNFSQDFNSIQQKQMFKLKYNPNSSSVLKKDLNATLPENVVPLVSSKLSTMMGQNSINDELLIVDIRPFNDYVKSHITNSINVCLPSTLLKRQNFRIDKCINSLPDYEKSVLTKFNEMNSMGDRETRPNLVLYDNYSTGLGDNNSQNISNMCQKFIQDWSNVNIFVLQNGYQEFSTNFENNIDFGVSCKENNSDSDSGVNLNSSNSNSQPRAMRTLSLGNIPLGGGSSNTPVLSRFVLPEAKPVFKIRHNEEIVTKATENFNVLLDYRGLSTTEQNKLPGWVKKTSNEICDEFNYLEKLEQNRLTNALNINKENLDNRNPFIEVDSITSPPPTISSGIEYGYKNRYKDIFLYEHSRVKLRDIETTQKCDYINASYITGATTKYIATQGPLSQTIGDFWKCVVNEKVPIIISLTRETENGIVKCSPYWNSGEYMSNENKVEVKLLDCETVVTGDTHSNSNTSQSIVLRSFEIIIDDKYKHKVLQIHVLSWPDMELIMNPKDLLSIVLLKDYVMKLINSNVPVLVHCSAGCGRTGVLCATDTVIDTINKNDEFNMDNLIFSTVDRFRKQRVSMVQTLRQYVLIYDLGLIFLRSKYYKAKGGDIPESCQWNNFNNMNIINKFIEEFKTNERK